MRSVFDLPDVLSIDDNTNYYYALGIHDRQRAPSSTAFRPVSRRPHPPGQRPGRHRGRGVSASMSTKHKLAAFCISAFFSGLAGAMLIF